MKHKRTISYAIAGTSITVAAYLYFGLEVHSLSIASPVKLDVAAISHMVDKAAVEKVNAIKTAEHTLPNAAKGVDNTKAVRLVAEAVLVAKGMANFPEQLTRRSALIDELLAGDRGAILGVAAKALTNRRLAEAYFGSDQAWGRILCIDILGREAEHNGDKVPLLSAIKGLVDEMKSASAVDKGMGADLEDLLGSLVSLSSKQIVEDHLYVRMLIDDIGFVPKLRKQFVAGVYFGLMNSLDNSAIESILNETKII